MLLVLMFFCPSGATAQTGIANPPEEPEQLFPSIYCPVDGRFWQASGQGAGQDGHALENEKQASAPAAGSGTTAAKTGDPVTYYIPVMVHILHYSDTSDPNYARNPASVTITPAQVQAQLDVLNQDFSATNADLSQISGMSYESRVGNARIQFCLAKRDANNNPTTGIEVVDTNVDFFEGDPHNTGFLYASNPRPNAPASPRYPTDKYLNIWVCALANDNRFAGVVGVGTPPGYALTADDGVVVHTGAFGTEASGRTLLIKYAASGGYNFTKGRVLTHEVGHWLNLRHIWGDDNGACPTDTVSYRDDMVDDTPPQGDASSTTPLRRGCPQDFSPNPYYPSSCSNGMNMYMNFMDNVCERCQYMFSNGQVKRMREVLTTAQSDNRMNLLNSTGNAPAQASLISTLTGTTICEGDQTNYRFQAVAATPCGGSLSYRWIVPPGWSINSPALAQPTIIPNGTNGGTVSVVVTYTNGTSSVALPVVSLTISLTPSPHPAPTFTSAGAGCAAEALTLSVGSAAGANGYRWTIPADFTPGGTIVTSTPSLTVTAPPVTAPATYTVACQVLYKAACPVSPPATQSLTIAPQGAAPVFASAADACQGRAHTFAVNQLSNATAYEWTVPNGFSPSGTITTSFPYLHVTLPSQSYSLTYSIGCRGIFGSCTSAPGTTQSFYVRGNPVASIDDVDPYQRDGAGKVCPNKRLSLRLNPAGYAPPLSNYAWSTTDGTIFSGQGTNTIGFRTPGPGTQFILTATFSDACGGTGRAYYDARTVTTVVPYSYLENGYNCGTAPARPYPNPANESLSLAGLVGRCVLYNHQGQPVASYQAADSESGSLIDTRPLPAGFYALVGQNAEGEPQKHLIRIVH